MGLQINVFVVWFLYHRGSHRRHFHSFVASENEGIPPVNSAIYCWDFNWVIIEMSMRFSAIDRKVMKEILRRGNIGRNKIAFSLRIWEWQWWWFRFQMTICMWNYRCIKLVMFMILNGTKLAVKVTGDRKLIAKVFVYILSIHAKLLSIVAKSALVDNFVDKALSIPALLAKGWKLAHCIQRHKVCNVIHHITRKHKHSIHK